MLPGTLDRLMDVRPSVCVNLLSLLVMLIVMQDRLAAVGGEQRLTSLCEQDFLARVDVIIRTEESRRRGARFLNVTDTPLMSHCQQHCCQTDECNTIVLDKQTDSCYLFDCGTTEERRCVFGAHALYTSASLLDSRTDLHVDPIAVDLAELPSHAAELSRLRNIDSSSNLMNSQEVALSDVIGADNNDEMQHLMHISEKKGAGCGRHQFQCRSGECVAIYNVCDGVSQCGDASDEHSELGCPLDAGARLRQQQSVMAGVPFQQGRPLSYPPQPQVNYQPVSWAYPAGFPVSYMPANGAAMWPLAAQSTADGVGDMVPLHAKTSTETGSNNPLPSSANIGVHSAMPTGGVNGTRTSNNSTTAVQSTAHASNFSSSSNNTKVIAAWNTGGTNEVQLDAGEIEKTRILQVSETRTAVFLLCLGVGMLAVASGLLIYRLQCCHGQADRTYQHRQLKHDSDYLVNGLYL